MAFFYSDAQNSYLCIVERQKFFWTASRTSAFFDLLIQIWIEIMIVIKRMRFFLFFHVYLS